MKLTFNGGAREVGGSAITLDTSYSRVALDYGIKVEEGLRHDLPRDLDAVVVTHAHLDHSGNLLTLSDSGTTILGSKATRDITSELLEDLLKVHRMRRQPLPYDHRDVEKVRRLWFARERVALPGMELNFYPAGHVLGARMVHLKADGKNIVYTGDFCLHDTEILDGADVDVLPEEPDILIMESTYGGTPRPSREELVKALYKSIVETEERGGNILIPSFAFHRMQEMTRRIDIAMGSGFLPKYNAYYLSGLAYRIAGYFNENKVLLGKMVQEEESPFNYKKVKHLRRMEQIREPALVVCTAGFGHAGVSRRLLFAWISEEDNTVLISTGFLPKDSPLSMALENDILEEDGEKYPVRATVRQVELSGHADQNELTAFVKRMHPKKTFLVHGNPDQAEPLGEIIKSFTEVLIPSKGEEFEV